MNPFRAGAALHRPTFLAHTELGEARVGLELTLPLIRKRARERKLAIDFKEAACCPSAVVQGAARQKSGLCEGSAQGNWDPRKS